MGLQNLRWAAAKDIESLLSLLGEYHEQEGLKRHSKERTRQALEELFGDPRRGRVVLAELDGQAVGYALVVRRFSFEWTSEVAVLDEIFVRGKAREKGFGRRMLAFVEEYVASEGLPSITLEVNIHNVGAREFYRQVGFQRVDREIYARTISGPR
jgi:ribosomal protein S18 acetylase RimI-like enzyme